MFHAGQQRWRVGGWATTHRFDNFDNGSTGVAANGTVREHVRGSEAPRRGRRRWMIVDPGGSEGFL